MGQIVTSIFAILFGISRSTNQYSNFEAAKLFRDTEVFLAAAELALTEGRDDPRKDSAISGFRGLIQELLGSSLPDRMMVAIGESLGMDRFQLGGLNLLCELALEMTPFSNTNAMRHPGLCPFHVSQPELVRLVDVAPRVGLSTRELIDASNRLLTHESLGDVEKEIDDFLVTQAPGAVIPISIKALLGWVNHVRTSGNPSVDRFRVATSPDNFQQLLRHMTYPHFNTSVFLLAREAVLGERFIDGGLECDNLLDEFSSAIEAVIRTPRGFLTLESQLSEVKQLLVELSDRSDEADICEKISERLSPVSRQISGALKNVEGEWQAEKEPLMQAVFSVRSEARIALIPKLVRFIEISFLDIGRDDAMKLRLVRAVVDASLRIINAAEFLGSNRLVSLADLIEARSRLSRGTHIYSVEEEVIETAFDFARRFGLKFLADYDIVPDWSAERIRNIRIIISAFLVFGKNEWDRHYVARFLSQMSDSQIGIASQTYSEMVEARLSLARIGITDDFSTAFAVSPGEYLRHRNELVDEWKLPVLINLIRPDIFSLDVAITVHIFSNSSIPSQLVLVAQEIASLSPVAFWRAPYLVLGSATLFRDIVRRSLLSQETGLLQNLLSTFTNLLKTIAGFAPNPPADYVRRAQYFFKRVHDLSAEKEPLSAERVAPVMEEMQTLILDITLASCGK